MQLRGFFYGVSNCLVIPVVNETATLKGVTHYEKNFLFALTTKTKHPSFAEGLTVYLIK